MCQTGFTGNGKNCTNIDECAENSDDCHSNATCTDTEGSFTCACNVGYTGNETNCFNIDECITATHNCAFNATCTDNDGSNVLYVKGAPDYMLADKHCSFLDSDGNE